MNAPPYKIIKGEIIYNMNNDNFKEKGERGELFELLAYGKVFHLFKFFDLLFMANEKNDDLDIDTHLKKFNEYCKREKDLKEELKSFPKNQLLSNIVEEIFDELEKDNKLYEKLSNEVIAFKEEGKFETEDIIQILESAENIVTTEVCPLSRSKPEYKYYVTNS